ncbi:MAG: hypothetical protein JEZ07_19970 [Phycisphaerae bacterium]|nr:hypothetical protein [Phycisphaerae bacterium]
MQPDHDILKLHFEIPHKKGEIKVLKQQEEKQAKMGEALTLDAIVNSIDAELIAKGTSGKGPNRGAIVRHGPYTLWAFEGPVENMTETGKKLFVNTVYYAAKQRNSPVLERKLNKSRDNLFIYLSSKGLLGTLQNYLPKEAKGKTIEQTYHWLVKNRMYLRIKGRAFEVDELARKMNIANFKKEYLQRLIVNLRDNFEEKESYEALVRYTGMKKNGHSTQLWQKWFDENRDYLFFSDTQGSKYLIDTEAKAKGITTAKFRNWSSEELNFRVDPGIKILKEKAK